MNKLLVVTVLIAALALGAESFRMPRQAEEGEETGTASTMMDGLRSYYDKTVNMANEYLETLKGYKLEEKAANLYHETTSAVKTYAGILHDQLYHTFYPQESA
ncbi:apolipoprotein C-II [Chanos chanos]|uniref:Apolipoprotein C-II n=1 Tax=Chanos chanos TaxID=29144 RepID=A0A6J2W685_CHACN|nr:apolipoprotein C-II-like [Chanos chanos]